jgi:arylsulfatase A-like enzyme
MMKLSANAVGLIPYAVRTIAVARSPRAAPLIESSRKYSVILLLIFSLLAFSGCSRETKVYDFVENFPLADVQQELTLIDFGTPPARRHLLRGWSVDHKGFGRGLPYVWSVSEKSVLEFFLSEARNTRAVLRCAPFQFPSSPVQTVSIAINGKESLNVTLKPGMHEYEVVLSRHALLAGKNRLEFGYAYVRAPKDVMRSDDPRQLAVAWDYIRFDLTEVPADSQPHAQLQTGKLHIPFGAQVDYFLRLPPKSVFTIDGLTLEETNGGQLHLVRQRDGEEEQIVEMLRQSNNFRAIPLPGDAPKIVRLSFRAVAPAQKSTGPGGVTLVRPAIRIKGSKRDASMWLSSQPSSSGLGSRRSNVVIYLIDALRADHLGCYGYQKPISPHIDAFAKDAILFENSIAQAPWTRSSVASIFTGLYPQTHGVTCLEDALPVEANTLAEILHAASYTTAAFITNGTVGTAFGFDQGFADFFYLRSNRKTRTFHQLADRVNEKVFSWLEEKKGLQHPFFLYVHTTDPHSPYAPPEDYRTKFASSVKQPRLGSLSRLKAVFEGKVSVTKNVVEDLISLYDAEIAHNDHHFGVFLEELKKRGLYEDTLIILVSDHGEEFYERGTWEHQKTLYAELLNIPLIVKFPSGIAFKAKKSSELAQHVDILPMVLDVLGLKIPEHVQGHSLLPSLSSGKQGGRLRKGFSYFNHLGRQGLSVVEGPWKLIRHGKTGAQEHVLELYNHEEDPGEKVNVLERHSVVAEYLLSLMKTHEQGDSGALKPRRAVVDEELREKLKALGYVQ